MRSARPFDIFAERSGKAVNIEIRAKPRIDRQDIHLMDDLIGNTPKGDRPAEFWMVVPREAAAGAPTARPSDAATDFKIMAFDETRGLAPVGPPSSP